MRPQPLIAVRDVEASSRWYRRLLGCVSDHGGTEYERLNAPDGTLILQLHDWKADHHHGPIGDPDAKPVGNGLLLWFEVDDFDGAVSRVEELRPRSSSPATAIPTPTTGKSGCATLTATPSCWRVRMGRRVESQAVRLSSGLWKLLRRGRRSRVDRGRLRQQAEIVPEAIERGFAVPRCFPARRAAHARPNCDTFGSD